jgi:hypothetical protein
MLNPSLITPIVDERVMLVTGVYIHGPGRNPYRFKCPRHYAPEKGMLAVVETGASKDVFSIVRITEVETPIPMNEDDVVFKWVVSLVRTDDFERWKRYEKELTSQVEAAQAANARAQLLGALGLDTARLTALMMEAAQKATEKAKAKAKAPQDAEIVDDGDIEDEAYG